jgi:hypothetical protein
VNDRAPLILKDADALEIGYVTDLYRLLQAKPYQQANNHSLSHNAHIAIAIVANPYIEAPAVSSGIGPRRRIYCSLRDR